MLCQESGVISYVFVKCAMSRFAKSYQAKNYFISDYGSRCYSVKN